MEVPWVSPSSVLRVFVARDGHEWCRVSGVTGVYCCRVGTCHTQWAPPRGKHRQAQGGIQTLDAVPVPKIQEQIVGVEAPVVDVLVTMLHTFQQFDREGSTGAVLGCGCGRARRCAAIGAGDGPDSAKTVEVPQLQFLSAVDIPVVARGKSCGVQR